MGQAHPKETRIIKLKISFSTPRFFSTPLVSIYTPKTVSFEKFRKYLPKFFGFMKNKWLKHLFFYIGKLR
jgi:hypothetical protein